MEYKVDCKSVGERIKARKQALGITVNDLCERSGVPLDTINNIVYGRSSDPRMETMSRLAIALDTTLDFLVHGKAQPTPEKDAPAKEPAHKCYFDSERYIQILNDVHKRELESQAKSKNELITELRDSCDFWKKLSCSLIASLGAIIVYFIISGLMG